VHFEIEDNIILRIEELNRNTFSYNIAKEMNEHHHMFQQHNNNNLTSRSVYEAVPSNSTYHQHQLIGKMGTSGISKTNRSQSNEPPQNILSKKQPVM